MPVTKSAKKKLRQDEKRQKQNLLVKKAFKETIKKFKKGKTPKLLSEVFSALDSATKKKIIHANKASRLKSRLSKLLIKKTGKTSTSRTPKKKSPMKKKTVV